MLVVQDVFTTSKSIIENLRKMGAQLLLLLLLYFLKKKQYEYIPRMKTSCLNKRGSAGRLHMHKRYCFVKAAQGAMNENDQLGNLTMPLGHKKTEELRKKL